MAIDRLKQICKASLQGVTYIGIAMIALTWGSISLTLSVEREKSIEAANQLTLNMAQVFEEHVLRVIKDVDKTLLLFRSAYEADPAHVDLDRVAASPAMQSEYVLQLALVGSDGTIKFSTFGKVDAPINITDREHFQRVAALTSDDIVISKPVMSRITHMWSVQLMRRLRHPDGSFAGAVFASVDPIHLSNFYNSIDLGQGGAVTLIGLDRVIRARGTREPGNSIGQAVVGGQLFDLARDHDHGNFTTVSAIDNVPRIAGFRVIKGFPLIVTIAVAQDDVLAAYHRNQTIYVSAAGVLTLLILCAITFSVRHRLRHDATDRALRQSEAATLSKTHELGIALENMNQGILMTDRDGVVAVLNRKAVELLDLPERFLDSRPQLADLLRHQWESGEFGDEDDERDANFERARVAAQNLTEENLYQRTRPNGTILEVRSMPLPGGGFVRTFTDITEARRQEDIIKTAVQDLERFAHLASHDLQEPLRKIGTYASMLTRALAENDEEEVKRSVRVLIEASKRGRNIVSDLLRYSRLRNRPVERAPVLVHEMLADVVSQVSDPTNKDTFEIEHHLPPIKVNCDGSLILQVLQNLIGNAIKYKKPDQKAYIVVYGSQDDEAGRYNLHIADNGIGFDTTYKHKIFQPFQRLVSKDQYAGTGIGLSLVRSIVEKHGWTIDATSEVGVGSTFTIAIPLRDVVEAKPASAVIEAREGRSSGDELWVAA